MELNKEEIEELLRKDKGLPLILKGLTIQEFSNNDLLSTKYIRGKDLSYRPAANGFYKPVSKCIKIEE